MNVTVKEILKDSPKSLRIKTVAGKNLNIKKSQPGWERLKEEGASFDVETKPSSFVTEDGEEITMNWIESFKPAKAGHTDSTQESIEKQVVFKSSVELACARIAAGTEQTEGQVLAGFKFLLGEFRHVDDVVDEEIEF